MSRIVVLHRRYGCETGCCGHAVEVNGVEKRFDFEHPYLETLREFAERFIKDQLGEEHIADLDWDHCQIMED